MVAEVSALDILSLMPERRDAEDVFLTKEESGRMQNAECQLESTKQAFLFSCYTGLLKGEVRELSWDSIRLSGSGMVLIRSVENSEEKVKVPIIEPAREILQNVEREYSSLPQDSQDDRVFHLYSNMTINDHIKRWAKDAGVNKNVNYMTSRHTFATMALRAGVDLYVLPNGATTATSAPPRSTPKWSAKPAAATAKSLPRLSPDK